MATVTLRDTNQVLSSPDAIQAFLEDYGIWYRRFEGPTLPDDATTEEILAAYEAPIAELMADGGYQTADVITITPDIPGLDDLLAKFDKEHTHAENEVRFMVGGRGMFHVHGNDGRVFGIEVHAGDMINVPKGTKHWFHVCDARRCRAIRLYEDMTGWTPHYTASGVDGRFPPVWTKGEGHAESGH